MFETLMPTLNRIRQHLGGAPLYLVGGTVRDHFLGFPSLDLDLVVDAPFEAMDGYLLRFSEAFPDCSARLSMPYRTLSLKIDGHPVDLVPMRKEHYRAESHLPHVSRGTFIDDVLRRDFTVNSLYVRIEGSQSCRLIDPLHGLDDVNQRLLRLNYRGSFRDDPTRMIRLFIYRHRLDFAIAEDTLEQLDPTLMEKVPEGDLFRLIQEEIMAPTASDLLSSLSRHHLLVKLGIYHSVGFDDGEARRSRWMRLLRANPELTKTFEELGIYSTLVRKTGEVRSPWR